jgi:siroheme synthase (precorrin-2 oxidase/ferrochelatase)
MGIRSQQRTTWPKRHDAPTHHTVRRWICADCLKQTQLVNCADDKKRCPECKTKWQALAKVTGRR